MNEKQEKLLKALEDYYDEKDKNRTHTPGKDVIQHAGPYLRKEEFMAAIGTLLRNGWFKVKMHKNSKMSFVN